MRNFANDTVLQKLCSKSSEYTPRSIHGRTKVLQPGCSVSVNPERGILRQKPPLIQGACPLKPPQSAITGRSIDMQPAVALPHHPFCRQSSRPFSAAAAAAVVGKAAPHSGSAQSSRDRALPLILCRFQPPLLPFLIPPNHYSRLVTAP